MGIEEKGQICVMIHSGSRGFGHQVATGYYAYFLFLFWLNIQEKSMKILKNFKKYKFYRKMFQTKVVGFKKILSV